MSSIVRAAFHVFRRREGTATTVHWKPDDLSRSPQASEPSRTASAPSRISRPHDTRQAPQQGQGAATTRSHCSRIFPLCPDESSSVHTSSQRTKESGGGHGRTHTVSSSLRDRTFALGFCSFNSRSPWNLFLPLSPYFLHNSSTRVFPDHTYLLLEQKRERERRPTRTHLTSDVPASGIRLEAPPRFSSLYKPESMSEIPIKDCPGQTS